MKKKLRVYQEDVKSRHTAHWDWDYLTWEEIENRLREANVGEDRQTKKHGESRSRHRSMKGFWIGLGLLIASVLILAMILR